MNVVVKGNNKVENRKNKRNGMKKKRKSTYIALDNEQLTEE